MRAQRRYSHYITLEWMLWGIGLGLAVALSIVGLRAAFAEQMARSVGTHGKAETRRSDEVVIPGGTFAGTYLQAGSDDGLPAHIIGQLKIQALDLSAPLISSIADLDLARGVGHVPGTGTAGGLGNMAVAGHRDTFFRPLQGVKAGMMVTVSSLSGRYRYQIDRTEIIEPEQLKVLDIGDRPQLTMITCYPFNFIGAAPKRSVVIAHLVSAAPDETTRSRVSSP